MFSCLTIIYLFIRACQVFLVEYFYPIFIEEKTFFTAMFRGSCHESGVGKMCG